MSLVYLSDRRPQGDPDPCVLVTDTFGGKTFKASRRTFAHLRYTQERLERVRPGAWIRVIQGTYSNGVYSAGTHDGDGVLDVEIVGWDDWAAEQRFLRGCGWADWWRHTGTWASPSAWHHHMISLGTPALVGVFVPGQVDDYYRHALGLKGQHDSGNDPTWHPADIDSTVFDYPAWAEEQDMASDETIDKIAQRTVELLLAAKIDKDGKVSVKQALNQTRNDAAKAAEK